MGIRIQPEEICVPKDNPFKDDLLGREQTAEVLTRFIDNIDGPGVLAIDASWGAGKTTFLRMWKQYLHNEGFPVVMFNAWDNDFSGNPFISLTAELTNGISEYGESVKPKVKRVKKLSKFVPSFVRAGGAGLSTLADATVGAGGVVAATGANFSEQVASKVEKRLDNYWSAKESEGSFRDSLQDLACTLSKEMENHPLIVIIDELDRCRPTYAIELLETAKHLFTVDKIVFVLGINIVEMSHSIKALYGNDFNAEGYLERFIDLDFPLTDPNPEVVFNYTLCREKFINEMFNTIKFDERTNDRYALYSKAILLFFFRAPAFSLRRIARALLRLGVVLEHLPDKKLGFTQAISVLLIIRTLDKGLYLRFVDGSATDREVANEVFRQLGIQRRIMPPSPSKNIPDNSYAAEFEILLIAISHYSNQYNSNVERNSNEKIAINSDLLRCHEENAAENNTDEASKQYSEDVVRMVTNLTTGDRHQSDFQRRIRREVDELKIAHELLELQSFEFYRNLIDRK